jgi:hypothetical protein
VCSINVRGGTRGGLAPDTSPCETLAATSSRSNFKALAARAVFHLHTCGLCRDAAVVVAALIGYNDVEVAAGTTTWRR